MDQRIEAAARALCLFDGLDPDAAVAEPVDAGPLRSSDHHEVPQWRTRAREAARFLAMLDAALPSGLQPPGGEGGTTMLA